MSNHKVTKKQLAALGITRTRTGDYDYIDPYEKQKSKTNPNRDPNPPSYGNPRH